MNRLIIPFLSIALACLCRGPALVAQSVGTQEYDSFDCTYVDDIYFWPQGGVYLAVMHHDFYNGPTQGPPNQNKKIKITRYVLELNRTTGETKKSSRTPDWVKSALAANKLAEAQFIKTYYEETGVVWNIGPFQITEATVKDLPFAYRFYDGYQGDIVYVQGQIIVFGDAGYMDHTNLSPALFKPGPDMNYWELNRQGYLKYEAKKYSEAADLFLRSLAINPDYQHANYNLACMYSLLSRPFADGKPYLEKLLQNPDLKEYYLKKIPTDTDLASWLGTKEFRDWLEGLH